MALKIFTKYENPDMLSPSAKNIEVLGVFAGGFAPFGHASRPPTNTPNPYFVKVVYGSVGIAVV
jgi:hypothetical protein